jgi:type VI secretion system secreted protein VgrG
VGVVIKQTSRSGVQLGFYTASFADDPRALSLLGAVGREELSRLFEYDILLARHGEPLTEEELAALVTDPCVIALGNRPGDIVHGVLSEIEHVEGTRGVRFFYVAKLVPYTSLLTLGRRSAIYQDMTVPELVAAVLGSYGLSKGRDFEIRVSRDAKSPKHEYIAQYNESDWDFVQRWLEREGFFYWFTHTKKGAKLVIADENADATPIDDPEHIAFRENNNLATDGIATIWDFRVKQKRVAAKVSVVDYNYRKPRDLLMSTKKVDDKGFGHVFHYGEHFKDAAVGDAWAQIRSEELMAERHVVSGKTDCSRFRVGHSFEFERHYVGSYDGKYLITSLEHRVGIDPAAALAYGDGGESAQPSYSATFKAIPLDVPFRPRRRTAWPRIDGVINGHIEADTNGDFAQVDAEGRYKVKLPFDFGTKKGLTASRWIRMAQAYSGGGYGTHLPQHKGTEVLLAHIDGDPDRPVIVASVPNALTPGPVANGNATQSVTMTASGMRIELEDQA